MFSPLPHLADIAPYALSRAQVPDGVRPVPLAQNECLRAPSPRAIAAARAACDSALYPDPDWTALRNALAETHGLNRGDILCGAGSLELIAALARAFTGPGRAVLIPAHAYPFFASAAGMTGARVDTAPEQELTVSVDTLLAAVRPDTAVVFVANPANPTGTEIAGDDLRHLRAALPGDVLLVIDQAYGEYSAAPPLFDLAQRPDTVILRSFSKAYGLASARVGWGVFPPGIAGAMRKVLNPNNIAAASQAAATAALKDPAYMRETVALTTALRGRAFDILEAAGLPVIASATNFLLLPFDTSDTAARIGSCLLQAGVLLRPQAGVGLPNALRMTIGPEADLDVALAALTGLASQEAL